MNLVIHYVGLLIQGSGKGAFTEWKSSNTLILEFSAREKRKVRAIELSPSPTPRPGKVQTCVLISEFSARESSKCARLNFPSPKPFPSL